MGHQNGLGSQTPRASHNSFSNQVSGMVPSLSCPSIFSHREEEDASLHGFPVQPRVVRSASLPSHVAYEDCDPSMSTQLLPALNNSRHWFQPQESLDHASTSGAVINRPSRGIAPKAFRRPNDASAGHHNVVDIERIRQGSDVRTTVRSAAFALVRSTLTNISRGHASKYSEQNNTSKKCPTIMASAKIKRQCSRRFWTRQAMASTTSCTYASVCGP